MKDMGKAFCVIMWAAVLTLAACDITTETECEEGGDTWVCQEDEQGNPDKECVCDVNRWNGDDYGPDPLPW